MSTPFLLGLVALIVLLVLFVWWLGVRKSNTYADTEYWLREADLTEPVILRTENNATVGEATNICGERVRFGVYRFPTSVLVQEITLGYPGEFLSETRLYL